MQIHKLAFLEWILLELEEENTMFDKTIRGSNIYYEFWKSARKRDPDRRRKRTHLGPTISRPQAASSGYFPFLVLFFFTDSRNR